MLSFDGKATEQTGEVCCINADEIYSGDFLMNVGVNPSVNTNRTSVVLEIKSIN